MCVLYWKLNYLENELTSESCLGKTIQFVCLQPDIKKAAHKESFIVHSFQNIHSFCFRGESTQVQDDQETSSSMITNDADATHSK